MISWAARSKRDFRISDLLSVRRDVYTAHRLRESEPFDVPFLNVGSTSCIDDHNAAFE